MSENTFDRTIQVMKRWWRKGRKNISAKTYGGKKARRRQERILESALLSYSSLSLHLSSLSLQLWYEMSGGIEWVEGKFCARIREDEGEDVILIHPHHFSSSKSSKGRKGMKRVESEWVMREKWKRKYNGKQLVIMITLSFLHPLSFPYSHSHKDQTSQCNRYNFVHVHWLSS